LSRTQKPGTTFGSEGKTFWFRPDADVLIDFNELTPPSGVYPIDQRPSWATYGDRLLEVGGSTENLVVTGDYKYWKQGIRPPKVVPEVTLTGTGWTAELIVYYTLYDAESDERSALSAPSATQSASNQGIRADNMDDVADALGRATHVEAWLSVDGGLPRLAVQREIGMTGNVTLPDSLGELGESFTEEFELFPRCRYNVIWHDRQIMSGDDENPNRIYVSLIGLPERRALFSLDTKTRQPVTGLFVVNDQLIVGCPFAQERMHGYTEDDLGIEIAQPNIGLVSHWSVQVIHGYAWFLSQIGWYVTDGSAWFFVSKDIDTKLAAEYETDRVQYEDTWSVYDPKSHVYIADAGTNHSSFTGQSVRWAADYKPVLPAVGGGMGQPNWSYDVSTRIYNCGAVMAVPGSKRHDVFFGGPNGIIYKQIPENETDAGDSYNKLFHVIHATEYFGDCGGDLAHGKEITEVDFFVRSEFSQWEGAVYSGDAEPYPQATPAFETGTVAASELIIEDDFIYTMQPQWTHRYPTVQLPGQGFQVEIVATAPTDDFEYAGYAMEWKEGIYDRTPALAEELS